MRHARRNDRQATPHIGREGIQDQAVPGGMRAGKAGKADSHAVMGPRGGKKSHTHDPTSCHAAIEAPI